MARWLFKEEPTHYSFTDLVRDRTTRWEGVHNPLALRHLRTARRGDQVFYYHSGNVRAVVGIARITRGPVADATDGRPGVVLNIAPVRPLTRPVPMAELRADPALEGFVLFRIGRLSVMPVTDREWGAILAHEGRATAAPATRTPSRPRADRRR